MLLQAIDYPLLAYPRRWRTLNGLLHEQLAPARSLALPRWTL